MLACNTSHTATVDILLKCGADVNVQRRLNGLSALMMASQTGDTKIAEILLNHGADVDMKDKNGATALMFARQNRHRELAKLLEAMSTTNVVLASPKSPFPVLSSIHEVTSGMYTKLVVAIIILCRKVRSTPFSQLTHCFTQSVHVYILCAVISQRYESVGS